MATSIPVRKVTSILQAVAAAPGTQPTARVIYDLDREGFHAWPFLLIVCGFVILSIALIIYDRRHPGLGARGAYRRLFFYVFAVIAFAIAGDAVPGLFSEYRTNVEALRAGQYQRVEGIVENFVPAPLGGHRDETFDVAGHHYSYSDYVVIAGYHQSQAHGGAVHQGARVRIADLNGTILRLEVLQ